MADWEPHVRLILERTLNWIWYRPNPVKWLLWPIGGIYRVATELRRLQYRRGLKSVTALPVPVIVVGNITVGGTGKTPVVIWLATQLEARGYRVGIVSRGYGGSAKNWPQQVDGNSDPEQVGDEPVLLVRATGCPVVVDPNRAVAAQALHATGRVDVILSDDGLQHYALHRSIEIAVVDGNRGIGNGFSLPAGPLREPSARLDDVDAVVVNGGSWERQGAFRAQAVADHVYQAAGTGRKPLQSFRGTRVHAVAGIGHPERFFDLLETAGLDVIRHPMPDHAKLSAANLEFDDASPVLVTEKDAVKCQSHAHANLWCVPIKLELNAEDGERLLQRLVTAMRQRDHSGGSA